MTILELIHRQLFKRLFQLTGIRISDPHLSSSNTLGDLYGHFCAAAKPKPTSLYKAIFIEAEKAQERVKRQAIAQAAPGRKADLRDLINLGNVELRRRKANKTEKRTKIGQEKVINYALWERGLHMKQNLPPLDAPRKHILGLRLGFPRRIVEGTRTVPEFGRALPSGVVNALVSETKRATEAAERLEQERLAQRRR